MGFQAGICDELGLEPGLESKGKFLLPKKFWGCEGPMPLFTSRFSPHCLPASAGV